MIHTSPLGERSTVRWCLESNRRVRGRYRAPSVTIPLYLKTPLTRRFDSKHIEPSTSPPGERCGSWACLKDDITILTVSNGRVPIISLQQGKSET